VASRTGPSCSSLFSSSSAALRDLHSFPTRRSSDLRRCALSVQFGRKVCVRPGRRMGPFSRTSQSKIKSVSCRPSGAPSHFSLPRSEEHTSELQSRENLVCRLLLEKKKQQYINRLL